jgi:MtN3 and saliva related transmembrane protein
MDTSLYFGFLGTILLPLIPIPQLFRIYRSKKTKDLSIIYILVQILANSIFVVYGALLEDLFIIIPNAILVFLNFIMIGMKITYDGDIISDH